MTWTAGFYIWSRNTKYYPDEEENWELVHINKDSPVERFWKSIALGEFGATREYGDTHIGHVEVWYVDEKYVARGLLLTEDADMSHAREELDTAEDIL